MVSKKHLTLLLPFIFQHQAIAENITYTAEYLQQNPAITEQIILDMLQEDRLDAVELLLPIYQNAKANPTLLMLAKIKLAQQAFIDYKNKDAENRFNEIKEKYPISDQDKEIINQFLITLEQRDSWQFSFGANYVYNKNVNNATRDRHIENTGFVKNDDMMPKSAKGFAYDFSASRNWNLSGSHNVSFSNELSGKYYWDNHDYDEITNRTYLGYLYQNAKVKWVFKPFYERQWFGNHRYQWAKGIRVEWQKPFAKEWQISTAFEWSQPHYFTQTEKNGTIKLISATLIWQPSEKGYFYIGSDFIREQTRVKQYSNDTKSLRLGWINQWKYDIVSQINVAFAHRQFKDSASLGNILPLNKIRQDKIYSAHLTLWKSDWHLWGMTPKIQFKYKRQDSNIASMFSYSEKYVQMLIEKDF